MGRVVGLKSIIITLALIIRPTVATVHLLPVVDLLEKDIGQACDLSWIRLQKCLTEIQPKPNLQIYAKPYGAVSTADVLVFYQNLEVNPKDVLWFYYCGHGETAGEHGHILKIPGGDLRRVELRRLMESKKAQGVLITTDACASEGTYSPNVILPSKQQICETSPLYKSLIENLRGTVDINAATDYQPAYTFIESVDQGPPSNQDTRGALFSGALTNLISASPDSIDFNLDQKISWGEAFSFLRETTIERSSTLDYIISQSLLSGKPADGFKFQVPHARSLGAMVAKPISNHVYLHQYQTVFGWHEYKFRVVPQFHQALRGQKITLKITFLRADGTEAKRSDEFGDSTVRTKKVGSGDLGPNYNEPWAFEFHPNEYDWSSVSQVLLSFKVANGRQIHLSKHHFSSAVP